MPDRKENRDERDAIAAKATACVNWMLNKGVLAPDLAKAVLQGIIAYVKDTHETPPARRKRKRYSPPEPHDGLIR